MTPVPQSIYDRAELLSRSHGLSVVAELIGKDLAFVSRMRSNGWKARSYRRRPRPTDFAIQARRMSKRDLCGHYNAGWSTVKRWLGELQ